MSTGKGYIKIYRDIRDNWIWEDAEMFKAWLDILMLVNHKDKKTPFDGKLVLVKKGSKITSLRKLAIRWGWSKDKTARFLDMLESDGMIRQTRDSKKTLITVVNYSFYQDQTPTRATPKRHRTDTDKDTDKDTERNKQYIKNNVEDIKKNEEEIELRSELTQQELEEGGWGFD